MNITRDGCAYKVLANIFELYNMTIPKYLQEIKCDECNGECICKVTLETLVKFHAGGKTKI